MAEFTAAVENYDRFMGRYATGLAPKFADAAGVRAGMRGRRGEGCNCC